MGSQGADMGEFDDTLSRILGDPSAMAQIARLAQSLGGPSPPGDAPGTVPPGTVPPQGGPPPGPPPGGPPSGPSPGSPTGPPPGSPPGTMPGYTPPGSPAGPPPGTVPGYAPPDSPAGPPQGPPPGNPSGPPGAVPGLTDSPVVRKLLPLLLEGRQNSNARQFLYALRPYLNQRRQENVERALQLARLWKVGRRFLSDWEG